MALDEKVEIQKLKNACVESFEILYFRYSARLYNFVMKMSGRNNFMAEELVQRTFIKIWENREHLNAEKSFIAYLCTIAKNMLINEYEHQTLKYIYQKKLVKMSNSTTFLDFYNKIDTFLKNEFDQDIYLTFSKKVRESKNYIVRKYQNELISLGELRNAIVHNPRIGNKPIAEPHKETVRQIEKIYTEITDPPKVYSKFNFEVIGASEEDFIMDILKIMKEHSFSQLPVFNSDGKVIEVINTNTISRWLSSQFDEDGTILLENVRIKDLIPEIEFKKNYKFISRNASVYEAYDLFVSQMNDRKSYLDILFITQTGKESESLLGLITIEDITKLL